MKNLLRELGYYKKTVVALVGAAVVIIGRLVGVDSDLYFIVTTLATALGVFGAANAPELFPRRNAQDRTGGDET